MTFESFFEAQSFFLWATFGLALFMGAVVNKTNFRPSLGPPARIFRVPAATLGG
jgi:hypothetical protein